MGSLPIYCACSEVWPIEKIISNPKNPNTHPDGQLKMLAKIIKGHGWRAPRTVADEMKSALHKRAIGYEVEETDYIATTDGKPGKIIRRERHIPGDPKAMMQYLSLYGGEEI